MLLLRKHTLSSIALKHIPKAKLVRLLFGNGNVIKKAVVVRYRLDLRIFA